MYNAYLDSAILVLVYMVFWFFISWWRKDNSLADIAWGTGFICIAVWVFLFHRGSFVLLILTGAWGLRLSLYLLLRNLRKGEDWRYRDWRESWGKQLVIRSFLQVFMLQGFFMWLIALPLMQGRPEEWGWLQYMGIFVWLTGFLWEAVADWQLMVFKNNPENKGKVFTGGLWGLSRHPNYFGEIVAWWGIFIFVLSYGNIWISLVSPLTITWLLARVSGVPMLEKKYKDNPDYLRYIKSTNALLPDLRKMLRKA